MSTPILDQKKAYRRGLLLGFTMAEVTIMVLFCLLLASALVFEEKLNELARANDKLAELSEVRDTVSALAAKYGESGKIDDIFTELRFVKRENTELKQRAAENEAALIEVKANAELLREIKVSLQSVKDSQPNAAEVGAIVKAGLAKGEKAIQCERDAIEKNRLEGQLASAQATLTRLGKGTEMPACWANPKTGRPEYIFSIDLTSTGLVIHDERLEHRQAEQSLLPLSEIGFDTEVSPDAFRIQTGALWLWSKEHQCRFFVMVRDKTQPTEKDTYKRLLRTLEDHFYKLEVK
jgi:hypothetical protein